MTDNYHFYSEEERKSIMQNALKERDGLSNLQWLLQTFTQFTIANYENCGKKDNTVTADIDIPNSPYTVHIETMVVEKQEGDNA